MLDKVVNIKNCPRSEYHTQLAKMSFDKIFDLTAGVYFNFSNIIVTLKDGFYSFRAQTDQHHPVNPGTSYTTAAVPRGVADLYPVAPVAYQVILEPGIGQFFREFEPHRVHTRINSLGLFLAHKSTCGKRESVS